MEIILSTTNPSKAEQIKALFKKTPFNILTLSEAGIEGEAIEDGATLTENALKKAHFVHDNGHEGAWAMADDTGLYINALDGRPGIKAARWAGEEATTTEITQYTLDQLAGKTDRSATFETVVAIVDPEGNEFIFNGTCRGALLDHPKVPAQPKMPYSPLFMPNGSNKVWAEMTPDEENDISHRGKAFRAALSWLETKI